MKGDEMGEANKINNCDLVFVDRTQMAVRENIETALNFIPADDRDTWIKCGMAIKAELGDSGLEIWDRWSASADSYHARDASTCWRSFKASGAVGIGTLFYIAKLYGYQRQSGIKPTLPTPEEIAQRAIRHKAEDDLYKSRCLAASDNAAFFWNSSESTPEEVSKHPYQRRKHIQSHGTKIYHGRLIIGGMDCNRALMIPMMLNGKISSLQFINCDGEKRFLKGGEKGSYLIGNIAINKPICISEGFATGASIHQATDYAVIVAFDAGNLCKIAKALRAQQPDAMIVLCADDDAAGRSNASEAARVIGGFVATPIFSNESNMNNQTDFNDMAKLSGLGAVKLAIDTAISRHSIHPGNPI
jgi:putative DNA primase/helicase